MPNSRALQVSGPLQTLSRDPAEGASYHPIRPERTCPVSHTFFRSEDEPASSTTLRRKLPLLLAALCLLAVLTGEEWLSIRHLSITVDEGAHTYAGYQHWRKRDFGVNPEHPPLVKLVAAAPLLGLHLQQPHPPPINFMVEQYMGGSQLYTANDGEQILTRARRAASLFTLLLALLVFAASYEIFGGPVALIALFLFTFEPTLLAHGALITTDMGVACFLFASFYTFYRFLKQPGPVRLLLCGLAVGLALAAKVSGVLALPILVLLAVADLAASNHDRSKRAGRLAGSLVAIFLLGYGTLWAFYTFRYAARPAGPPLNPTLQQLGHMLPHTWQTKLLEHLAATHLLPEGYLYAWAKLFSNITATSGFLFGRIYPAGTWTYFPAAFVVKSTLSLLFLLILSPLVLRRLAKPALVPAVGLGLAFCTILLTSMTSHLDIGVRHILALYPFAVVLAAAAAWAIARASRLGAAAVAALLLFQCISSLHSYPDYLPYANEAFGGPRKAYLALTDSNVDWGQQLKEVNAYLQSRHITDCWIAYSNMDIAPDKLPCKALPTGLALIAGQPEPLVPPHIQGAVLISAEDASGALWGPGALNPYRQFQDGHPADMIGNSILVYRGGFDVPLAAAATHMSQVPTLLRMRQPDAALAQARAATVLGPQSPILEAELGGALLQLGRNQEAQQAFASALEMARMHQSGEETGAVEARIGQIQHSPF